MNRHPVRRALAAAISLLLGSAMALASSQAAHAEPASDVTLSSVTLSAGAFDTPFDPEGTGFTATVPHTTTWFSFTPTATDPEATIVTWNGNVSATTPSGTPTASSWLRAGANIMTATVSNGDAPSKQYVFTIVKDSPPPPAYDLDLESLTLSTGELTPAFSRDVTSYSVDVPYTTNRIEFAAIAADPAASVTVTSAGPGTTGEDVFIPVSGAMVLIAVTAPDRTSRTYSVNVTRGPVPTADVDLASLGLSAGTLTPSFDPAVQFYTATVPYAVRSMQITASASTSGHAMVINNQPMTDGVPVTVPLSFDRAGNGFAIRITADNGVEKIYSITITRDLPSDNADLTGLSLSGLELTPAFSNDEPDYTAAVPYLTTSTTVTATVADPTAIIRVNHRDTPSGEASAPVALAVGENTISVVTTAEDSVTTTTHTVVVTRAAPDLDLSALTVVGGDLSPAFDSDVTDYTLTLPYPVASVDVAASAAEPDWTLEIQGAETDATTVAVPVGASTITARVTALYGESRAYTVAVTREAPSTDATLKSITLSAGTLSPEFSADETDYTASVGYLTEHLEFAAAVADSRTSLTINGEDVTSTALPLKVGENPIVVVTTAEDGITTITTTVVVTREQAPAAVLSLDLGFKAGDRAANAPIAATGRDLLPGSTATLTMHSTPVVLATGTVSADGWIALRGTLPTNVEPGAHRLVLEATAVDGPTVAVSAWFTVLRDGTIGAVSLTGPVAYVEPAGLAATGVDGTWTNGGAAILAMGALLMLLGGALRRRNSAA